MKLFVPKFFIVLIVIQSFLGESHCSISSLATLNIPAKKALAVCFDSTNENIIRCINSDEELCSWDLETGDWIYDAPTLKFANYPCGFQQFTDDGLQLIMPKQNGDKIQVKDGKNSNIIRTINVTKRPYRFCAISRDKSKIAYASTGNEIVIINALDGSELRTWKPTNQSFALWGIDFSSDGKYLVYSYVFSFYHESRSTVVITNLETGDSSKILENIDVSSVAFSADNSKLFLGSLEGKIRVMDLNTKSYIAESFHGRYICGFSFNKDRTKMISQIQGSENTVKVWNIGCINLSPSLA